MFIGEAQYLEIIRTFRAQPAHRRPNFLDASQRLGHHRNTLKKLWAVGLPATKDPRRPTSLPALKEVCAPGTEPPPGLYPVAPVVTPAPPVASVPLLLASRSAVGPSSEPSASAPGDQPSPSPTSLSAPASAPDPVAEIIARQAALAEQEARNLAGSLRVASHISSTGDAVLKLLYDAVTTPAAQERLRAYIAERPERFPQLLGDIGKALEAATKASERVFGMTRLARGQSTSIQEFRSAPPPETPEQAAARVEAVLQALADADRTLGSNGRSVIDAESVSDQTADHEGDDE
jgi:hypothetical protein